MQGEAVLLRAAAARGVPVPTVVADDGGTALGGPAIVMDRLDGETIARKLLRDDELGGRPRPPHRPGRRRARPPSTRSRWPTPRRSARGTRSMRCGRCWTASTSRCRRSSSACAGSPPTGPPRRARPSSTATSGWATSWSGRRPAAACSIGSWPTSATRSRTSAGTACGPGGSARRSPPAAPAPASSSWRPTRQPAGRASIPRRCDGGRCSARSSGGSSACSRPRPT